MSLSKEQRHMKRAAIKGDYEHLKKYVTENRDKVTNKCYLNVFPDEYDDDEYYSGNIFHLAAEANKDKFIKEAIAILPKEDTQKLLLQKVDDDSWNPLHTAASAGNIKIVKAFLTVYKPLLPSLPDEKRPWLQKDDQGRTPCFVALDRSNEECGLELLKMDMDKICMMECGLRGDETGLLYNAVLYGYSDVALTILKSPHRFTTSGYKGDTPFHVITRCTEDEGKEIFYLLLKKEDRDLIKKTNNYGGSMLHSWADDCELWPFQYLLDRKDIIPDISKIFAELVAGTNNRLSSPLHRLVLHKTRDEERMKQVAELLIKTYRQEESMFPRDQKAPWLVENKRRHTPFSLAIEHKYDKFATYLLDVDENVVTYSKENALFMAITKECTPVAERILKMIVHNKKWTQLLTNDKNETVLHPAPLLSKDKNIFTRLLEEHSRFLTSKDIYKNNILHYWLKEGGVWQLEELLKNNKWRKHIIKFISDTNNIQNNPLHVIATTTPYEAMHHAVELLVNAYKEENPKWVEYEINKLPWFCTNKDKDGPLHLAIRSKNEKLALFILGLHDHDKPISKLLDYYSPKQTLFLAIKENCPNVAKDILKRLDRSGWKKYLVDSTTPPRTVLHIAASRCKDNEDFGRFLLDKAKRYITYVDKNSKTPLDEACEVGAAWFIKAFREKYPKEFDNGLRRDPLPWIKSCEKGHLDAIHAIIDANPGKFRDHCIKQNDTPLHHIKLKNLWEYEDFMKIPYMNKDLLNLQDSEGDTPLHKAIKREEVLLTQTLLGMENIKFDIKGSGIEDDDKKQNKLVKAARHLRHYIRHFFSLDEKKNDAEDKKKTATELLKELCHKERQRKGKWNTMCQKVGYDPDLATSYIERKTNLLDVRNSLFVVAALLATITFTAGFTLPGGTDNGNAIWVKRTSFYVFMISNTLAMCSSMMVLICLVYSMVHSSVEMSNQSLKLIDRSMQMILVAFYSTILAFMTGVYLVIPSTVLWLAIVVIVMCSLIGISVNRDLLFIFLVIPSKIKKNLSNFEQEDDESYDEENQNPSKNDEESTTQNTESENQQASEEPEEQDSDEDYDSNNDEDTDGEDTDEDDTNDAEVDEEDSDTDKK